jgi:hypothetical protein
MDKELKNHLAHSGILLEIEKLFPFYIDQKNHLYPFSNTLFLLSTTSPMHYS